TSIFTTLLRGDRLLICEQEGQADQLLQQIFAEDSGIRALKMTPSHVHLLEYLDVSSAQIEKIILGGEALTANHCSILFGLNPELDLYNEYGPTEATVGCTVEHIRAGENITVGRPIAGAEAYVMDGQGNLCPIGCWGELYIGGKGVAKAYRHREELTAERFVEIRLADKSPRRVYRSGDILRWNADGKLEYKGRRDEQIKIRGHRIECAEIECCIEQVEDAKEVAVLAIDKGSEKELLACVVLTEKGRLGNIRQALSEQLPAYLIPTHWMELDRLPLTTNGKTDKKSLRQTFDSQERDKQEICEPQTETEQRLATIWKEVLQMETIGIHQDFFALGGHSLKGVKMLMLLQEQLGVKLELQDLFAQSSIHRLAAQIDGMQSEAIEKIPVIDIQESYELSSAQERMWALASMEKNGVAYHIQSVYRFKGNLNTDVFAEAIRQLMWRHEILRTNFVLIDEELRQIVRNATDCQPDIRWETAADSEEKLRAQVQAATQLPFDLETDRLFRTHIWSSSEEEHILLFNIHHIICDGWSPQILSRDLEAIYNSMIDGGMTELPLLRIQYKDYAAWMNAHRQSEAFQATEQFWLQTLEGELPRLDLPTDAARPHIQTFDGASEGLSLTADISKSLQHISSKQQASLFHTLTAILNAFLHRISGQGDILLGTPVAGRRHFELKDQIGIYTNTLVLRNRV
ncbi:MAG: condensation domain-containing protein, partial [Bacteroidota bacterium]